MIVALDGHMIGAREMGNETYATQLSAALGRIGGYRYRLYTPHPEALPSYLRCSPSLSSRAFPDLPSYVRIPYLYPKLLREDGASLLHVQYIAPPLLPCPSIVSVHDVSYRIFPDFFSPKVRLTTHLLVGPSMRRSARVIALSEHARRDILRFYKLPRWKVVVIPAAAAPHFKPQPPEEVARVRGRYSLPEEYVLAVGNVQPRKNLKRLVEAFGAIAADFPQLGLAIVGRSGWRGSEVEATVSRLGLDARVRFTGYVSEGDLPALYTGAALFCYTSLYEGFGLPPLEAMACGTPAVTSNSSSLPEVVGDAALQVSPTAVEEIAGAMRRMLGDPALRAEYSRRGLQRAGRFSWERTAMKTRNIYDAVLGIERKKSEL